MFNLFRNVILKRINESSLLDKILITLLLSSSGESVASIRRLVRSNMIQYLINNKNIFIYTVWKNNKLLIKRFKKM